MAAKREIVPRNDNGSIRLRFAVQGKRYSLGMGGPYGDRQAMAIANAVAAMIELDIQVGGFDPSMRKYRDRWAELNPLEAAGRKGPHLLRLWDEWVETLKLPPETKADHYEMVRRMLVRDKPRARDAGWFVRVKDLAPATWNKRLGYLRRCLDWVVARGKVDRNPYREIQPRKVTKAELKPLSIDEIGRILMQLQDDWPGTYHPFSAFLLATGCRTSEAIGLRWGDVDFVRGNVTISSSLGRDRSSKGCIRKRKTTKTGTVRSLELSGALTDLLAALPKGKAETLVFRAPGGGVICDMAFRKVWIETLAVLDIPYRKPYISRHSVASHALDQGASIMDVARLLGHKDGRMVTQTYGHAINPPTLPNLPIGGTVRTSGDRERGESVRVLANGTKIIRIQPGKSRNDAPDPTKSGPCAPIAKPDRQKPHPELLLSVALKLPHIAVGFEGV